MRLIYRASWQKPRSKGYLNFIDNSQMIHFVSWASTSDKDIYFYKGKKFHREGGPAAKINEWCKTYYEYWLNGEIYYKTEDYNKISRFPVAKFLEDIVYTEKEYCKRIRDAGDL